MKKPTKAHAHVEETAPVEDKSAESFSAHLVTPMGMMLFIDKPTWDAVLTEKTFPVRNHIFNSTDEKQFSVAYISVDDKLFLVLKDDGVQGKLCKLFPASA